jgi:hypothetical protein
MDGNLTLLGHVGRNKVKRVLQIVFLGGKIVWLAPLLLSAGKGFSSQPGKSYRMKRGPPGLTRADELFNEALLKSCVVGKE